MNGFKTLSANLSLSFVMLYALMTVLAVFYFKVPALGVAYSLAIASGIFFISILRSTPKRFSLEVKLVFLLVVFCGVSLVGQGLTQKDYIDYTGRSVQVFSRSVYTINTLWVISGMAAGRCVYGRSNLLATLAFLIVGYFVFLNLGDGFLVSYSDIAEEGFEGVNHLLVIEMVMLISYFAYSMSYGAARLVFLLAIAFLAFSGGGRSSFYFGVAVPVLYEVLWGTRFNRNVLLGLSLLFLALLSYFAVDGFDEQVQRMLFSGGVGEDMSYSERGQYFSGGMAALPDQMLFGDPGWIVRTYGTAGAYIHNIFSAWQFFGVVPFFLVVALIFLIAKKIWRFGGAFSEPPVLFGVLCFSYAVLGIFFSKFIGFSFLWFSLGFWAYRLNELR